MSFSGISFIFWRMMEILTLIPIVGMLAWFVHLFDSANPQQRTPDYILILFIVSVLAAAWTMGTLFLYARAKHSASFVAFIDLCFVGALIAAVYELRAITNENCSTWTTRSHTGNLGNFASLSVNNVPGLVVNKQCAMLKASFALGIMNCIFFFLTFLLALLVHRHHKDDRVVVKRETHYSRHGHRSNSHSSRSPRRSHHSSRRSHYV